MVFLDEIPKGPTGKLQRIGLAEKLGLADTYEVKRDSDFVAPGTAIEKKLAEIWSQFLEADNIGIHDNFFQLGGDSVIIFRIIARMRDNMQAELSIVDFFRNPTIFEIAKTMSFCIFNSLDCFEIFICYCFN